VNASSGPISLQCCHYYALELSEDRGVAAVRTGQIVLGGEVLDGGGETKRQFAFDYVADIKKRIGSGTKK